MEGSVSPSFSLLGKLIIIELVETTANLEHVLNIVQNRWGAHFVLVTSDGLERLSHKVCMAG